MKTISKNKMEEKIRKNLSFVFYVFVWLLFIWSSFLVFVALSDIEDIEQWKTFLMFVAIIPFLSAYILRNHFKFLMSWVWEKENLHKLAIIIIVISILLIAIKLN